MFNNTTCHSRSNVSIPSSSDDQHRDNHDSFRNAVYFSTSMIIACLSPVTLLGNALIVATIWRRAFVRTSFHILLSGLAFTDFCTGIIAQPLYAAIFLIYCTNPRAMHDMAVLFATIYFIGVGCSIFFITITISTITVMSIERWLYMSRRFCITSHRRHFTITVIIMLFFPIPSIVIHFLDYEYIYDVLIITEMSSCYLITLFAYFKVYQIIRHHQHQIQASRGISQNFGQSAIDLAKYKKSVATMLYILLLFSFCFLPYIVSTAMTLSPAWTDNLEIFVAKQTSMVLVFLSSSLNPGLYLWRMRDIRNGLKQLLS